MVNSENVRDRAKEMLYQINQLSRPVRLMEVCGTHTNIIFSSGIRGLLPRDVELVSGPGCPICVTPSQYIDQAVGYARLPDSIIASFGDMLKVPGTSSSLAEEMAKGADIRVVYSPLEAVNLAVCNPGRRVIFLAVGFETTAPTVAAAVLSASNQNLSNFFVLTAVKQIAPALKALLSLANSQLDGLLLPGHVCMITGIKPFTFLPAMYSMPAVITGFEPLAILESILLLLHQLNAGESKLENAYKSVVRPEGNSVALTMIERVFQPCDATWRGLGTIQESGFCLRPEFVELNAAACLPADFEYTVESKGCRCGDVLCGLINPPECTLFAKQCTPLHPLGACMVSSEGVCSAWFKYGKGRWLS